MKDKYMVLAGFLCFSAEYTDAAPVEPDGIKMGATNIVPTGSDSLAAGWSNNVSNSSLALGTSNIAGEYGLAVGEQNKAFFGSIAVGAYNTSDLKHRIAQPQGDISMGDYQ